MMLKNKEFWPSNFGGPISESERHLFSLSARVGGMGISDPVEALHQRHVQAWS